MATMLKALDETTIARIINGFLSCEDDERLTDMEVEIGGIIFSEFCERCPRAMLIAQGRDPDTDDHYNECTSSDSVVAE
jgi:hypothetical protein